MAIFLLVMALLGSPAQAGQTVTKAKFMEVMKTALPSAFCKDKMYFRQCFKITEDECIQEALRDTKICLTSEAGKLPDILNQPQDGQKYGREIGSCAGATFSTTLGGKKIDSPLCNDPKKWQGTH